MTILGQTILEEDLKSISKHLKPISLKKGDIFIQQGEPNDSIGIILNGLMIGTYISDKGKIVTSKVYCLDNNNNIVSNHDSFVNEVVSDETIKAIEDTQLMVIKKKSLDEICHLNSNFERLVRNATEKSYIDATDRLKKFLSLNAKERIADYYNENKNLFNRIDKQVLASYLGVNRNDFSKYLTQINKEE